MHGAGQHRRAVAALLDRGAHDDGPVAARHEVDGVPAHQAAHRPLEQGSGAGAPARRRAEAEDVALDGAHLGEPGPLEPADGGQAGPGRQDDVVRAEAAPVRQDELGPGADGGHRALDERHAGLPAGCDQRGEQGPVVHLVVARHLDPAAEGGAERRDERAALAGAAAPGDEAERVLVREEVVEAGAIGRIERDRHRAGRVVADGLPGRVLERGGEARPPACALEQQRGEGGLTELGLGDGGEHAGRHPGRAVTSRRRCDDRHFMTVA